MKGCMFEILRLTDEEVDEMIREVRLLIVFQCVLVGSAVRRLCVGSDILRVNLRNSANASKRNCSESGVQGGLAREASVANKE